MANYIESKLYNVVIGIKIRKLRIERKWTQEELAFRAGMDVTYISDLENGKRNPTNITMKAVAEALEIEYDEIYPTPEEIKEYN
ncbi:helix-turn-helix transcriptional regulator [Halobacillus sp. ACCC02827]|uniref:helix-turn-helix domain-containing protein n=1 Tax=Halobacillus sp. ACCC02827 TaxID=3052090 RepID=UPI0025705B60|nr:helix-turn-helix transcriptional regulator [Halobacillus sp. ACCC02827]WJE15252.1 helix-turn-helix transcriptional regulator [Halobacillus sp. ACCC02827]